MNPKKFIAISLAVMAAVFSFGCGNNGNQGGSNPSAGVSAQQEKPLDEETVKSIFKTMSGSNLAQKKAVCPIEKLPIYSWFRTPLKDESSTRIDLSKFPLVKNLVILDIKQDGNFATAKTSWEDADGRQHNDCLDYFIRVDGKWCYNIWGFKSSHPLNVDGYDTARLEVGANIGYNYENDPMIIFDVRSKTETRYYLIRPNFVLVTDQGEFPMQNTSQISVPSGDFMVTSAEAIRFGIPFKGAVGAPKALRITGFNETNSQGFPLNHDIAQVMTFTLSE